MSRWVAIALSTGAAAMVYAVASGVASYLSVSSAIVAMLHVAGYFVVQLRKAKTHVRASA